VEAVVSTRESSLKKIFNYIKEKLKTRSEEPKIVKTLEQLKDEAFIKLLALHYHQL